MAINLSNVKRPSIGQMKTLAELYTNAPKLLYGYGKAGAGTTDQFYLFKNLRGYFEQFRGTRTLANGDVIPLNLHRFVCRYETAVNNIIDLQLRFKIHGKNYAVESHTVITFDKNDFFVFTLVQFGK